MKIAMIGHKRIPTREGGVEIVVEQLATRLNELGHEIHIYNRKSKNDITYIKNKNRLIKKGIRIKEIFTFSHRSLNAIVYTILATIHALFGKYDIIHFHAEGPCSMIWLPHLFKIKTVATIHGLDWQRSKWGSFATKYIKFGEKMAVKYADEIIVLSKNMQNYFKKEYNRSTTFIPNGVNIPKKISVNKIEKKWGLEKNSYILFLARLVPEKGLHYLIEAYKHIKTDIKLVIAGASSHTDEYVKTIKESIKNEKRIIMTGFVQGIELEELFSNCLIYCLPSDVEGMPISLLEAMSYECNCLVSDIEENTQVLNNYGMTFKKGNIKDLENKLKKMLNNKKDLNSNIKKYIQENYNWDIIVKETELLYKKLY